LELQLDYDNGRRGGKHFKGGCLTYLYAKKRKKRDVRVWRRWIL